MSAFPFVFTILFLLLGPFRLIGAFTKLTQGAEAKYKHAVALRASGLAVAMCGLVVLGGRALVDRYRLSLASLQIAGGLVLLLSALYVIFPRAAAAATAAGRPTPMQLALSPIATPTIVSPIAVAALLIFIVLDARTPGILRAMVIALSIVLALDFLVMFFIDRVASIPGLMPVLNLAQAVLIFIQVALGIDTILAGLGSAGLIRA